MRRLADESCPGVEESQQEIEKAVPKGLKEVIMERVGHSLSPN